MTDDVLLRSDEAGIATLTLNRPEVLNALSMEVFVALDREIKAIAAAEDQIHCVILRGSGRSFCAGADLKQVKERLAQGQQTEASVYFKADVINALAALPQPVIGAVHGHCYTGGMELVLACDIIYAADNTRFADTHAKIGGRAAWGLAQRLPRRVGIAAAKEMMFSAREIKIEDALRIGLVNRVVPADQLDAEARKLAEDITRHPFSVLKWVKHVVDGGAGLPLDEAIAWERTQRGGGSREIAARLKDTKW
jgi:enoyl-CoA hydratase/carnithine racemase